MKEGKLVDESGKIIALETGKAALGIASKGINVVSYLGGKLGFLSMYATIPLSFIYSPQIAVSVTAILICQSYVVPLATNQIEKIGTKWGEEANEIRERQKKQKEDDLNDDWVVDVKNQKSVDVRKDVSQENFVSRIKRSDSLPSI